jgi:hypothetical protein
MLRDAQNPSTTYPGGVSKQLLVVTCADLLAPVKVQLWTIDRAGNPNVAISTLTIQDNVNACFNSPLVQMSGVILTNYNKIVRNVDVQAKSAGGQDPLSKTTNLPDGTFKINLLSGKDYDISAKKADEIYNGVSSYDIALITNYLLGTGKVDAPYSLIAADVDKSGEIDAADILFMRNFILRKISALPAGAWRFTDAAYAFKNPQNPFAEDFPELIQVKNVKVPQGLNFKAIKIGDVNGTYTVNAANAIVRSSRDLKFFTKNQILIAGQEYTIDFDVEKLDAAAVQFTLSFANGAKVLGVDANPIFNMSKNNFGVFDNAVTFSWDGQTPSVGKVFSITFKALKNGKLSDIINLGSALTPVEANDMNGNPLNIKLLFKNQNQEDAKFILYQNKPNPFNNDTRIGFELPTAQKATLTLYSPAGQILKVINRDYQAGYNEEVIRSEDLPVKGMIFYRLESGENVGTGKMLLID